MTIAETAVDWSHLWLPPEQLSLSQWAEQNIFLSPEYSARTGKLKLYGWQKGILDSFTDPTVETIVLMCGTQLIKCLDLETPLPTATGWKSMGDVAVGDEVFDEQGRLCKITAVSPVYRNRECYRITFDDATSIISDEGHYWVVFDRLNEHALISTGQIAKTFNLRGAGDRGHKSHRYRIQCCQAILPENADLPIEPYLFGCWLGDGHSRFGVITVDERDGVLDELNDAGAKCRVVGRDRRRPSVLKVAVGEKYGNGTKRADTFQNKLRMLGVLGKKHIPAAYLRASVDQRRALLQGVLDTDGMALPTGSAVVIAQKNRRLAHDILELTRSLGFKPTIKETTAKIHRAHPLGIKECGPIYTIYFAAYSEDKPFRLRRKALRLKDRNSPSCRPTESRRRSIVKVEKIDSVPVKCIAVDSPSRLYLAGSGMVPTHNTLFIQCVTAYTIGSQPVPMLIVAPKEDDAETFSKERLTPMIRDCPVLTGKLGTKSKDPLNTTTFKRFPGGSLSLVGAGAPGNAARRSICVAALDEIDKYLRDVGGEGDFVDLVYERLATYGSRKKLILACSPTKKHTSRIGRAYEQSDQREPWVPCPNCGQSQVLRFRHLRWNNKLPVGDRPQTARMECEHCGSLWTDVERWAAVERSEWRPKDPKKPFTGTAGFWLSHLYSPWKTHADITERFFEAKGDRSAYQVFVNTNLAELWEEEGTTPDWEIIRNRADDYAFGDDAVVPMRALFLTAFVDVQDDRLEYEVVGWGRGKENWSITYGIIQVVDSGGKHLSSSNPDLWAELDKVLAKEWPHQSGSTMPIMVMGVDTGFRPKPVYDFAKRHVQPAYGPAGIRVHAPRSVCPTKGSSTESLRLLAGVSKEDAARRRQGVRIVSIGTAFAKQELFDNLRLPKPAGNTPGPGYCHHPRYEEDYFRGLCSEKRIVHENDTVSYEKIFPRNEPLDCKVGNRAMAAVFGIDRFGEHHWAALEKQMGIITAPPQTIQPKPISETPQAADFSRNTPQNEPSRDPFNRLERRGGSWFGDKRGWFDR